MKRLLWLTENYPPQRGGMAQSCDRIVDGLRKVGFEIEIIHFTARSTKLQHKKQQNGGYSAIPFHESEAHVLNITWNHIETLGEFEGLVCFGGYLAILAAPIYAKWGDFSLYTFLRGNDFDTSIFTARKRPILQEALEDSAKVFAVSTDKVKRVKAWLPQVEVYFVPNSIILETWQPTESEINFAQNWKNEQVTGKRCLGVFGQLKAKKGIELLIDSLRKTPLTKQLHLLLIGDTSEELIELANTYELSFTHLPFQDRYELMKYYLCCDALVIPSYYDGMPNVMLEAGALGKPIIASAVDGMKDVIEDKKEGFLVRVGSEEDLRKVICDFCALSDEELVEMGSQLKHKIEKNYSLKNEIEVYEKHLL